MENSKNTIIKVIGIGFCLLALCIMPLSAAAQMTFGHIQVTEIDTSKFPDITVQAIIRDGNGQPVPESDLENLELSEDDVVVPATTEKVEAGAEVIFLLDMGLGTKSAGATYKSDGIQRNSRLEEMTAILKSYLTQMSRQDYAGIITIQPERNPSVYTFQPLTSDIETLSKQAENLTANPTTPSYPSEGLSQAVTELSSAQAHQGKMVQTIIFLSPGRVDDPTKAYSLAERAKKAGVTIHTVLVNSESSDPYALERLAKLTGGYFTHYKGDKSLADIFEWLSQQRTQYRFHFRTVSKSAVERTVTLRTKGTGLGFESGSMGYTLEPKAPFVEIVSPLPDQEFIRRASGPDDDMELVTPAETVVRARVSWPDIFPRKLTQAQLWLDGTMYGASITDIRDAENIQFTWDLKEYRQDGTNVAQLEVQVQDDLGFSSTSKPVTVKISVIKPTATPPPAINTGGGATTGPTIPCVGLTGLPYWLCWLRENSGLMSLGVALIALGLVVVFRGRISGAAVQMGDAVRQTIARITRPPQTEIGAYLTVKRGAEDLPRNRFPIYLNTVTPIGRDKRQAELVFDENAERSVISRIHCEITEASGRFTIRDNGSSHGTFVNGVQIQELGVQELCDGDQIELGPVERGGILLSFELARDSGVYGPPGDEDFADRQTEPADFSDQ